MLIVKKLTVSWFLLGFIFHIEMYCVDFAFNMKDSVI